MTGLFLILLLANMAAATAPPITTATHRATQRKEMAPMKGSVLRSCASGVSVAIPSVTVMTMLPNVTHLWWVEGGEEAPAHDTPQPCRGVCAWNCPVLGLLALSLLCAYWGGLPVSQNPR